MEQKIEFICEWKTEKYIVTELCKQFNISRTAAYKLIKKFESLGYDGLRELSRAPNKHPNATDQKVVDGILKLKEKYPRWGAKKLRVLLYNDFQKQLIPSVLTVHNILKKHGLVCPQKNSGE